MLMLLCLKQWICVTVEALNQRIFAFTYGKQQNINDKRTPNFCRESLAGANRIHRHKQNEAHILVLLHAYHSL